MKNVLLILASVLGISFAANGAPVNYQAFLASIATAELSASNGLADARGVPACGEAMTRPAAYLTKTLCSSLNKDFKPIGYTTSNMEGFGRKSCFYVDFDGSVGYSESLIKLETVSCGK